MKLDKAERELVAKMLHHLAQMPYTLWDTDEEADTAYHLSRRLEQAL